MLYIQNKINYIGFLNLQYLIPLIKILYISLFLFYVFSINSFFSQFPLLSDVYVAEFPNKLRSFTSFLALIYCTHTNEHSSGCALFRVRVSALSCAGQTSLLRILSDKN